MSSLADLPELVGFFSYSREDDEAFKGTLSALRDGIQRELSAQLGRSKRTFRLWQDQVAIAPGKLWESEIKKAIDQSFFFIPIITPRSVNSNYCKFEFESFLTREKALDRSDLIFPILYISVAALENEAKWRGDPVLSTIGRRQYVDWRSRRHLDVHTSEVREQIERFCQKIVEALNEPWTSPEEAKRAEEEQQQRQAEAKARQQAEEEARRLEAEAKRKGEEDDRKRAEVEARRRAEEERAQVERRAEEERKLAKAEAERAEAARFRSPVTNWLQKQIPQLSRSSLVAAVTTFFILLSVISLAFWKSVSPPFPTPQPTPVKPEPVPAKPQVNVLPSLPATPPPTPAKPEPAPAKPEPAPGTAPAKPQVNVPETQRAVLYEQDPYYNVGEGRQYVGSAVWRTETFTLGDGLTRELQVRAYITIPSRNLSVSWELRRNTDQTLSANYTIDIVFQTQSSFSGTGGVANVPGILMKESEQGRAVPLKGLTVKVNSTWFQIRLSTVDADVRQNMQLLKHGPWFEIPIVYNNGGRAILTMEKGLPGDRAFATGFNDWEQ
jgi:hypothetical protein